MKLKIQIVVFALTIIMFSCKQESTTTNNVHNEPKLAQVMERGSLRVVTDYNSTSYFIYRGQPMGYQYELLQELANHLGVKLEVVADNDLEHKFDMLVNDEIDLIAVNLTVTKERKEIFDFTVPIAQTRQVLVQRSAKSNNKMNLTESGPLIRNQLDLANQTIYVQKNSSYIKRLKNLSDEIGEDIQIVEVDEGVEKLIEMVSEGKINYTICDENTAKVNQTLFDNLDIETPVSFPQNIAWAVNKNSDDLLGEINIWLNGFKKTQQYSRIYKKYFENQRAAKRVESEYFVLSSGNLSPYDILFKQYSEQIGWDWRLLASMVYQESRFNPKAKSWVGAFGLMQLMPNTAKRFGVNQDSPDWKQIQAGIQLIDWLNEQFSDIENFDERQKFILAAYNVGFGHIEDARNLAIKYNKDPDIWEGNVDEFILSKSDPKYYKDPVVKYGYCRGKETYNYVAQIINRYGHYRNLIEK